MYFYTMPQPLQQHIEKYIRLTGTEYNAIAAFFKRVTVKKKENLLTEDKICQCNYFVEQGLLRLFFVNNGGVEQTTQFAMENWWLADYTSFSTRKPSAFNIQAVENSTILVLEHAAQEELLKQYPVMERYFRLIHERAHAAAQLRIKMLYDFSREELYHHFNNSYPAFVQRVPQYLLASFLGFTPEYLSEIRARRKS